MADMPRLALITGASRGLGAALAVALAPTHHILAVARTTGALEELDDRIRAAGGQATLAPLDITNADAMAHLCRSVFDRWGRVDLWAHTACHAPPLAPAAYIDAKDWDKTFATLVTATARLIPMVAPLLTGPGATALFLDDPQAGLPNQGTYGAAKAAQIALAHSWALETARNGPRVVIATPGPMPTATRARFHPGEDRSGLAAPRDEAARLLADIGMS